ncbi:hypothetical protein HPB49_016078 [Dermacentor silvarum]|uniref:Uncharacterized protein n=1 Tax=Dermacentor silvarum TaxID=543639 RepID=A0ACB8D6J1_DERSI|nr:hypothetical protein HPB49_016078 [Dermacentor silvarum]
MPVRTAGNLVTGTMYALFQKLGSARGVARSTKRKRTLASQNAFFVVGTTSPVQAHARLGPPSLEDSEETQDSSAHGEGLSTPSTSSRSSASLD